MSETAIPEKFDADFINRTFFSDEYKSGRLADINWGRCFDWSYIAFCLFPNVRLYTSNNHAWVRVGGKYYDSETIRGVRDYRDLPSNRAGIDQPRPVAHARDFMAFWSIYGLGLARMSDANRKRHWSNLVRQIHDNGFQPART